MSDILVGVLGFFAEVGRQLGFVGTLMALLAILSMSAVVKFAERSLKLLDRAERVWRRLPTPARHFLLVLGGLFLALALGPAIPWTPALVALTFGLGAAWWTQGFQYARRYGVRSGPLAAWKYHLHSRSDGLKMVQATEAATGRKNAVCLKVVPTSDGKAATMQPPDGQSLSDYAEEVNAGKHTSALARRFGLPNVKDVSAMPQKGNTVLIRMSNQARPDLLVEGETWAIPS